MSCSKHPQKSLAVFCLDCEECICTRCLSSGDHKGHVYDELDEHEHLIKTSLSENKTKLIKKQNSWDRHNNTFRKGFEETKQRADEVVTQIQHQCDKVCQQLCASSQEFIDRVRQECSVMEKRILEQQQEINISSARLENSVKEVDKMMQNTHVPSLISRNQALAPEIDALKETNLIGLEELVQWHFIPGTFTEESCKELLGEIKTSLLKCFPSRHCNTHWLSQDSTVLSEGCPVERSVYSHTITCQGVVWDVAVCQDGSVVAVVGEMIGLKMDVCLFSKSGELTGKLASDSEFHCVTEINDGSIAVSCHDDIKVYRRNGTHAYTLAVGQKMPKGMAVLGSGSLAVCYPKSNCVKIFKSFKESCELECVIREFTMEYTGQQVETNENGRQHLESPLYVAAYGETGLVISDWKAHTVYAFRPDGAGEFSCLWRYGGPECTSVLQYPCGVTTDSNGRIIIAENGQKSPQRILLLSHNGELIQELLTQDDGLCRPRSVSVRAGRLAVGQINGIITICRYL